MVAQVSKEKLPLVAFFDGTLCVPKRIVLIRRLCKEMCKHQKLIDGEIKEEGVGGEEEAPSGFNGTN